MKAQVLHSLKWVVLGKTLSQTVRWIMTFWVIRILSPEDYGYVAMADISFGLFTMVLGSLFSPYLIQSKEIREDSLRHIFGMILVVHSLLAALQYFAADSIGAYFNSLTVAEILKVNAICFIFMALEIIPSSLLVRKMQFKRVSIVAAISNAVAAIATLAMAYLGYGFWSLILGEIVCLGCRTVMLLFMEPIRFLPTLRGSELKAIWGFGSLLSIHALLGYLFLHMDIAIAGRLMSPAEVGLFAIALQFALMPQKKILPTLRQVAFPAFSRIQDQPEQISRYILKAQRLCLLLTIPIFWGIASVCDLAIPLFLGEKWLGAAVPASIILLVMPLRFCAELFTPALKSQKKVGEMIGNSLVAVSVLFVAILIGAQHGAVGLALAWTLGFPFAFAWIVHRNSKVFALPRRDIARLFFSPVISGTLMLLTVFSVKQLFEEPGLLGLSMQILAGGLVYIACLFVIDRAALKELADLKS